MAPPRRPMGTIKTIQPAKRQVRAALRKGYRDALQQLKTIDIELHDGERLRCRLQALACEGDTARIEFVPGVTRDNVARMRGAVILAPEDVAPNRDDAFDLDDLLGFSVVGPSDTALGTVSGVMDTKAGGILELETNSGSNMLLPAIPEVISGIDWDAERIVVNDIAPYAVGTDEE